jgi:hypothetical protein
LAGKVILLGCCERVKVTGFIWRHRDWWPSIVLEPSPLGRFTHPIFCHHAFCSNLPA